MPTPKRYQPRTGPATWRVRFRLGDGTNTSETFASKAEAEEFCRDVDELGSDEAVRLRSERATHTGQATLDELAEDYFTWKAKRVRSDRTVADYRRDYTNWIKPTFGRRRAGSISEAEVQRWVDAMHEGEIPGRAAASPKSIGDRHALLHGIYARGLQTRTTDHQPCSSTDLPKKQRGLPKGLRPNEWAALHSALVTISQDAADVAEGLLATGWRWSEVSGMVVGQLEDTGTALYATMDRVVRRTADGSLVVVHEGKGQASLRRVRVDDEAARMFRRRMVGRGPGDLVFTTPRASNGMGGKGWHYSNYRERFWEKAVDAANLSRRPTPHWLRHTHVAWMVLAGASLPQLQSRIGHASITTTINVYGRMIEDVSAGALGGFAAMRAAAPPAAQLEG